jgi:hypothetical protein
MCNSTAISTVAHAAVADLAELHTPGPALQYEQCTLRRISSVVGPFRESANYHCIIYTTHQPAAVVMWVSFTARCVFITATPIACCFFCWTRTALPTTGCPASTGSKGTAGTGSLITARLLWQQLQRNVQRTVAA